MKEYQFCYSQRKCWGKRESELVEVFLRCNLYITPQEFVQKWRGISREDLALICNVNLSQVNRWLSQGKSHKSANKYYQQKLAIADLLFSYYEDIPAELLAVVVHYRQD